MSYDVKKFEDAQRINNGLLPNEKPLTVNTNSINTDTSVQLVGELVSDYSKFIFENFTWIMENFSGPEPPGNPTAGQLWHKKTFGDEKGTLYVYTTFGSELPGYPGWEGLTTIIEGALGQHIDDFENPHEVTKTTIGLSNVENKPNYIKSLSLGDVINTSNARTNLNLYSTSEVYTKSESDALFIAHGSSAPDSERLGGYLPEVFMKSANPVATSKIDGTSIVSDVQIRTDDEVISIVTKGPSGDLHLNSGIDRNNIIRAPSAAKIRGTYLGKFASWHASLFSSSGSEIADLVVDSGHLTLELGTNKYDIYHKAFLPTPEQTGSLPAGATAVNTNLLQNLSPSVVNASDTVVVRDGNGDIHCTGLVSRITTTSQTYPNTQYAFRVSPEDPEIRFVNRDTLVGYLGLSPLDSPQGVKGTGHYDGSAHYRGIVSGMSSIGNGVWRVYTSITMPSNYCVVLSVQDEGTLYEDYRPPVQGQSATFETGELNITKGYVTTRTTTYFDVQLWKIHDLLWKVGDDDDISNTTFYEKLTYASAPFSFSIYYS